VEKHERYDRDNEVRAAVTATLKEFGYGIEAWTLADKPVDEERVLTVKASRNLRIEEPELPLDGGGGREATIDSAAAERLRNGSGLL
jgi:hypothetical protein